MPMDTSDVFSKNETEVKENKVTENMSSKEEIEIAFCNEKPSGKKEENEMINEGNRDEVVPPKLASEHNTPLSNICGSIAQNQSVCQEAIDKVTKTDNDNSNINTDNISSKVEGSPSNTSSLSIIAVQYENLDSDTETTMVNVDKFECGNQLIMEAQTLHEYRSNVDEETDSESDSSSSNSSDSSSSSSNSGSSSNSDSDDSDDTNGSSNKRNNRIIKGKVNKQPKQQQNEFDNLPPIENLQISVPEKSCDSLGEIAWTVEQFVVVKPILGKPTLNLDTILFLDKGNRALGKIFDVFGQVSEPYYSVRFNNSGHIKENDIKIGMTVYYCQDSTYTSLVFLYELIKMKGCDASGNDATGEPPDFSDDEQERAYYQNLQKQKYMKSHTDGNTRQVSKRMRTSCPSTTKIARGGGRSNWRSNHPWNKHNQQWRRHNESGHQNSRSNNHPYTDVYASPPYQSQQFNITDPALSSTYSEGYDVSQSLNIPRVSQSVDYNSTGTNQYHQGMAEWNSQSNYMHYATRSVFHHMNNPNPYHQNTVGSNPWSPYRYVQFSFSQSSGGCFGHSPVPPVPNQYSAAPSQFPNAQFSPMSMSYPMQSLVENTSASWSVPSPPPPVSPKNGKTDESKKPNTL